MNPPKLCECGCGEPAPLVRQTWHKHGLVRGEPYRFIHGHNRRKPADLGLRGLCKCGCGRETRIAPYTDSKRGHKLGHPMPYLAGHGPGRGGPEYTVNAAGCWMWARPLLRTGYAIVSRGGKQQLAHRWYYEQARGSIPEGHVLDHLCRNRACVNPDHLEAVTGAENCRRGANAILTQEQVAEIRAYKPGVPRYGRVALAAKYGVSEACITEARNGRTWNGA